MSYVDEIITTIQSLGGVARYSDLYEYFEYHSTRRLPRTWRAIVRARIEERSSDSDAFLGREDLFFSVGGKGNGFWGLRSELNPEPKVPDIEDPNLPSRNNITISRIIRDSTISSELKLIYRNQCQICKKTIILFNRNYSEGHHIRPLGLPHNGPDNQNNILILCPNHHVEFDYGAIAVDPDSLSIFHVNENNEFIGRKLYLEQGHNIDKSNLQYHFENIYKQY